MPVEISVFLKKEKMPSPEQWQSAIDIEGFDFKLDTNFDIETFEGFLPCRYQNQETGFEYYYDDQIDNDRCLFKDVDIIGNRDISITFVTYSDFSECASSMIAAAVLCKITDGVLMDNGKFSPIKSDTSIQWAKNGEKDCLESIG